MHTANRTALRLLIAILLAAVTADAMAAPMGPDYPPPNGVTFMDTGSPGEAGGKTYTFTDVDLAGLDALYWGPSAAIELSLNTDTTDLLTFAGNTATTATWTGTSTLYTSGGPVPYDSYFTLTLTGATFVTVGDAEITNGESVVAVITGDFSANFIFEIDADGAGGADPAPAFEEFDAQNTVDPSTEVHTSFGAGFWWVESEPLLGDLNCDDVVDMADVMPFSLALVDAAEYEVQFPECDINLADMNQDTFVDGRDVAGFVAALLGV